MRKYSIIFSLVCFNIIYATNHYVDKNANGTNNGTSWTNAWKSFSSINWGTIQPGDVIYISGGTDSTTYYENLNIGSSGNANGLIIIRSGLEAGHNGKVIIAGGGSGDNINITNRKFLRLKKLEISTLNGTEQGIYIKGETIGATNVIYIDSCRVLNTTPNGLNNVNCIRIDGYNTSTLTTYVDSVFIRYSYLEDTRSTPVNLQTDGLVMQYAQNIYVIGNTIVVNNDYPGGPEIEGHNDCIVTDHTVENLIIIGNKLINLEHNNMASQVIILQSQKGNVNIYNNIIASPNFKNSNETWASTFAIYENQGSQGAYYYIYENTILGGTNNYILRAECQNNNHIYFKNNIIDAAGNPDASTTRIHFVGSMPIPANIDGNLYGATIDYNNFLVDWGGYNKSMSLLNSLGAETSGNPSNRWNVNPLFTNASVYDYSLQPGSPAINKGVNLGSPYNEDILGLQRPQGSGNDIGAYEFINNNGNYIIINTGWNYISIPKLGGNMTVDYLMPTRISPVYDYSVNGYQIVDDLQNGKGYIVKFSYPQYIYIEGDSVYFPVQVNAGWNLIGPYNQNVPVSQINIIPPGIILSDFYGVGEYGYFSANVLEIGKGYWIKTASNGQIILNGGSLDKNEMGRQQSAEIETNWGKIKITNSDGKSITLYATGKEINSALYELPPQPPAGIFDVRYSSGKFVETLNGEKVILINTDKYPITLKAEGMDLHIKDKIDGTFLNEDLKNGEELIINNNKITSVGITEINKEDLKVSFELFQNYPNPFNPSTTIRFSIPQKTHVKLSIYNMLGELISTLVNADLEPSDYEENFNAAHCAAGVYLYRLTAGNYTSVKKMILLK